MAEALILLLFCLLLAIAAIMKKESPQTDMELSLQNAELRKQAKEIEKLLERIRVESDGIIDPISADWKKIAVTSKLVEAARKQNADPQKVTKLAARLIKIGTGDISQLLELDSSELERRLKIAASVEVKDDWRELVALKKAYQTVKNKTNYQQLIKVAPLVKTILDSGLAEIEPDIAKNAIEELGRKVENGRIGVNKWPPIINLSEAGGFFFRLGSAELSTNFERRLHSDIAERLLQILATYKVDLIEVIGHTDEQPIKSQISNLDREILAVLGKRKPNKILIPADNAGLGLARAISVVKILRSDPRLQSTTILPYSGAQLILPGDRLTTGKKTGDIKERRRIEIRVRRREN